MNRTRTDRTTVRTGARAAALIAVATLGAAFAGAGSATAATPNGATHLDPTAFNPVITGPAPVVLPANCPSFLSTDDWTLDFTGGGNAVAYGTVNKNGDWGGGNAEGPAALATSDQAVRYTGHLHVWFGGGQNSDPNGPPTAQSEQGFTLAFNGSGTAGDITINAHIHDTTNAHGTPTSQVLGIDVSCS